MLCRGHRRSGSSGREHLAERRTGVSWGSDGATGSSFERQSGGFGRIDPRSLAWTGRGGQERRLVSEMPVNRDDAIDRLLRNAFGGEKSPGASGACIKAELAAAWADGALSGRERSAIQAHAADCLECQALLSALARSARLPPSTPERRPHLVWLVPLTTVVAAAFVWAVVVRTPRSPVSMEQTARVIEPALPRPQEPVARQRLDQSTSPRPAGTPAETKTRDASNGLQATAANAQKGRLRVDG